MLHDVCWTCFLKTTVILSRYITFLSVDEPVKQTQITLVMRKVANVYVKRLALKWIVEVTLRCDPTHREHTLSSNTFKHASIARN